MTAILVTGANGMIGRKLVAAFAEDGHAVTGLDVDPGDDPRVSAADLAEWDEGWVARLKGVEVVVHLAATAWPSATWAEATRLNVDLTLNVYQAAAAAGVARVVFASTNWVLAGHRFAEGPLRSDTPPAPVNAYGASKLFGERAGLSFSRSHGLSVICLRIGAAQMHEGQLPAPDGPQGEWAARMWVSDHDLCEGFRRAVAAPAGLRFALLNLMSDNPGMRWDLAEAEAATGYRPRDAFALPPDAPTRDALARSAWEAVEAIDRFRHDAEL